MRHARKRVRVALMQQFIHLLDRILRTPVRTVAESIRLQIRLEDRFHNQLYNGLRHPIPYGRDSKRPLSAPGFGIITLRTRPRGYPGLYVLSCSSFPRPFNHSLSPAGPLDSMASKLSPSTPGAPSLDFASIYATRPVSRAGCSPDVESNHQLFEWVLPPLVTSPFGAHARSPALHEGTLVS